MLKPLGPVDARLDIGEVFLPLGADLPAYSSSHNVQPIADISLQLPWNESQTPTQLRGVFTLAGLSAAPITFDIGGLAAHLAANPVAELRLSLLGPANWQQYLPTGAYDYDVQLTATVADEVRDLTTRGTLQLTNTADPAMGDVEFGTGWSLPDVPFLSVNDGISPLRDAVSLGSGTNKRYSTSRVGAAGGTSHTTVSVTDTDGRRTAFEVLPRIL
ncbi:MAG: hypothetical protein ACYTHJ_22960 [Planctomycetota bacterium]